MMAHRELSLIDKDVSSLLEVPLSPTVTSLNLHCNRISRIEALTSGGHLRHLDLSSNRISRIEGLASLTSLRTLNLSCNLIAKVEGLSGLVNLATLNLSYNKINSLTGLLYLHGEDYKLKQLSLHSNCLDSINHLLQCLLGVQNLREVTLSLDGKGNPVCSLSAYRKMVLQSLPQVCVLDGVDRLGNEAPLGEDIPGDTPGLEDYADFLFSSETSGSEQLSKGDGSLSTPRINQVLAEFRQRGVPGETRAPPPAAAPADRVNEQRIRKLEHQVSQLFHQAPASAGPGPSRLPVQRAKRDIDHTSESEGDSGKENRRRGGASTRRSTSSSRSTPASSTPTPGRTAPARGGFKGVRARRPDSDQEPPKRKGPTGALGSRRGANAPSVAAPVVTARGGSSKTTRAPREENPKPTAEEETYRTIVEERDQERERRWKAEQAARRLTEQLSSLQSQACEGKDLQDMALHTTDRLKELLLRERAGRLGLQGRVDELEGRSQALGQQLEKARADEEHHKRALGELEESVARADALRAGQQAEEMKRQQDLQNRAMALKREAELQKAAVRQLRAQLQQQQQLLTTREQEHRKELASRLTPGGEEFRQALAAEGAAAQQRHTQREAELEEKLAAGRSQYSALEDEFRMALTIESARFSEVKEACDHLSAELSQRRASLAQSQQRERRSSALVQELTAMVKEQKRRISELSRAKREAVQELKSEQDLRLGPQLELLKKDKSRLLSQLTAQESVIDGLRAERKIWGQELAQQGVSLAQDRGRLEARVEVLTTELETQRKHSEQDGDALRIKAKIIDDQTATICKLKEGLQEREELSRRQREEAAQAQKSFQRRLEEEAAALGELGDRVEQLTLRKEQLKQQLEEREQELDELRAVHSSSNKKWQEKAGLLTRLEGQVMRMKDNFDSKERLLLEARDKAAEAHKAAVDKLHSVDDAFRRQLESLQATHHAELLRLASDKQKQIERANQKVTQVEEEMRVLLEETESTKRVMEQKMTRLSSVLKDF
ncbi:leucine-rich repeat and coiled-coil domain-containing protein 1 [Gadus macrocephalus]|uniref:leucine-rich repeat and coiled-coil domain-containing protein 1 n=1 Tax=Gadus macrocephalus TaxID=80720 RepID=UPI0028CBA6AA|nr:leucine-rich repeat and coiled-coil domain-containing protein 1 [Gadus macrocephalus]XP_059914506.1 leucine-rich repeat and coiled-coil domain-containing protein 1 [Gadus macrocephalus]